jgi:hypothetical protein
MAFLHDDVLDKGLEHLTTHGTRLDICSAEPSTFEEATDTLSLGNKTGITVGSPTDRSPSGRKVTVAAITDGEVTGTQEATHWAITDGSSTLLAAGALAEGQFVTQGNSFSLQAFDIGIPGPA